MAGPVPEIPVDGDRPSPTDAKDAPLIALGEALVRARASEAELAYELIAARADLQRIVTSVRTSGGSSAVSTRRAWSIPVMVIGLIVVGASFLVRERATTR